MAITCSDGQLRADRRTDSPTSDAADVVAIQEVSPLLSVADLPQLLGSVTIGDDFESLNFGHVIDLTQAPIELSYVLDVGGVTKDFEEFGPFVEVGLREVGAENFNPGEYDSHPGGKGGWMLTTITGVGSDENVWDADDKHNLQSSGNLDESVYDALTESTIVDPFGALDTATAVLFDRDGAPASADSVGIANTNGLYEIDIVYSAVSDTQGTMFATINGVRQGFQPAADGLGDLDRAGLSFTGDMTNMQVFVGAFRSTAGGAIHVSDLTINAVVTPEPNALASLTLAAVLLGLWPKRRQR